MTETLFIDGAWRAGGGEAFASADPAHGDTLWSGPGASPSDVRAAFAAARGAFTDWALAGFERAKRSSSATGLFSRTRPTKSAS